MKIRSGTTSVITMLALVSFTSAAEVPGEFPASPLCTTFVGPAFILPDELGAMVAVHAGPLRGVSFLSLKTGRAEGSISIPYRFLSATMPRGDGVLVLALSDGKRIRISSVNLANLKVTSTEVLPGIDVRLAAFSPNGKYLLGVSELGAIFKVNLATQKVDIIEGATVVAASLAVSHTGAKLYVAGDGLTEIDVDRMKVSSKLTSEKNLLEVVVTPDDHALALRNWHDIELLDLAPSKSGAMLASAEVDPIPNGASISSTSRLAFSGDGGTLFYVRASKTDSEVISLSANDLHVEARVTVGPDPEAIAIVPDRRWLLFARGFAGHGQLQAIDLKTQTVVFKAALPGNPSNPTNQSLRCARSSSTSN